MLFTFAAVLINWTCLTNKWLKNEAKTKVDVLSRTFEQKLFPIKWNLFFNTFSNIHHYITFIISVAVLIIARREQSNT